MCPYRGPQLSSLEEGELGVPKCPVYRKRKKNGCIDQSGVDLEMMLIGDIHFFFWEYVLIGFAALSIDRITNL